jgi:hypothetical protein
MPERTKVIRTKDRHEPGTGRRDRQKRQGRGNFNWGDPTDPALAAAPEAQEYYSDDGEPQEEVANPEKVKLASEFFAGAEDDEEEPPKAKMVVKVPSDLVQVVKVGRDVEVVEDNAMPSLQKKRKQAAKPEKKRSVREEEDEGEAVEDVVDGGEERAGRKQPRDKAFTGVQHNRDRPVPQQQRVFS